VRAIVSAQMINKLHDSESEDSGVSQKGFREGDVLMLRGLSAQAAIAIENARLFESEAQAHHMLDGVFHSIVDHILILDREGRLVFSNHTDTPLEKFLGRSSEQIRASGDSCVWLSGRAGRSLRNERALYRSTSTSTTRERVPLHAVPHRHAGTPSG